MSTASGLSPSDPTGQILFPTIASWCLSHSSGKTSRSASVTRPTSVTSAKKNLRRIRGKFTDGPNTNFLHVDRRISTYDSTDVEENEFDQELIAKYRLHPKFGLVLPTSVNDSPRDASDFLQNMAGAADEDAEPPVDHTPLIFQGPNGERIVTSRSYDHNVL